MYVYIAQKCKLFINLVQRCGGDVASSSSSSLAKRTSSILCAALRCHHDDLKFNIIEHTQTNITQSLFFAHTHNSAHIISPPGASTQSRYFFFVRMSTRKKRIYIPRNKCTMFSLLTLLNILCAAWRQCAIYDMDTNFEYMYMQSAHICVFQAHDITCRVCVCVFAIYLYRIRHHLSAYLFIYVDIRQPGEFP